MVGLAIKVELYVGRSVDFRQEVVLRDIADGKGPFISGWNIKDKPKPTLEELTVFDEEATRIEQERVVRNARRAAYPPIEDQLDMLWDAMDEGEIEKAKKFYDTLKAVKDDHPKPN